MTTREAWYTEDRWLASEDSDWVTSDIRMDVEGAGIMIQTSYEEVADEAGLSFEAFVNFVQQFATKVGRSYEVEYWQINEAWDGWHSDRLIRTVNIQP